eukprot:CAMPEP_0177230866 /NCGR_PEP_ID=MMETSP0367-20130122/42449_1 /TAXON_ID=447022 ORGANISM="Scrippsiella hangoei-like, Strain SHHI-4" /NCGR_SAMPLE_ID=MMETSP0367 /ASSEMBLY_ACC=CAM_ASM_000362 /LENGTH=175 /DNA_ID=CAMNT_0018681337 /DNA_START=344 /DNA_END=868 /DNA_ORIENTATION=+
MTCGNGATHMPGAGGAHPCWCIIIGGGGYIAPCGGGYIAPGGIGYMTGPGARAAACFFFGRQQQQQQLRQAAQPNAFAQAMQPRASMQVQQHGWSSDSPKQAQQLPQQAIQPRLSKVQQAQQPSPPPRQPPQQQASQQAAQPRHSKQPSSRVLRPPPCSWLRCRSDRIHKHAEER